MYNDNRIISFEEKLRELSSELTKVKSDLENEKKVTVSLLDIVQNYISNSIVEKAKIEACEKRAIHNGEIARGCLSQGRETLSIQQFSHKCLNRTGLLME